MSNRSRIHVLTACGAMLFALSGCGGGGSGGGAPMPPPATGTSLEVFVRGVIADDPSAQPREINDVPLTIDVRDDSFDDAFPS